jgi:hypothetical protein
MFNLGLVALVLQIKVLLVALKLLILPNVAVEAVAQVGRAVLGAQMLVTAVRVCHHQYLVPLY